VEIVTASIMWGGPDRDVLTLFVEPTPDLWAADPEGAYWGFFILRELDQHEQETGRVAGVEIVDFLEFKHWQHLPRLHLLWRLPGQEPQPLASLLRAKQKELAERHEISPRRDSRERPATSDMHARPR
jgi:hypothetical protein